MEDHDKLKKLLGLIDLTSLESIDNEKTITELILKANDGYDGHYPAAVCVYPNFGNLVRKTLLQSIIQLLLEALFFRPNYYRR